MTEPVTLSYPKLSYTDRDSTADLILNRDISEKSPFISNLNFLSARLFTATESYQAQNSAALIFQHPTNIVVGSTLPLFCSVLNGCQ